MKFLQIKERGPNFWGEPILQTGWSIWSPLLYLSPKRPMDPNSWSFISFQSILHKKGRFLSESSNFFKLNRGDLISGGNWFCRMCKLFDFPPVFIFWKFCRPKFSIINFISVYSAWLGSTFVRVLKFLQIKEGRDLISWGNQLCRMAELFGTPFCI